jgi:hypothetical protein
MNYIHKHYKGIDSWQAFKTEVFNTNVWTEKSTDIKQRASNQQIKCVAYCKKVYQLNYFKLVWSVSVCDESYNFFSNYLKLNCINF